MSDPCKKASELLQALIRNMADSSEKISKAGVLSETWRKTVGEKIASHAKLLDVEHGNLIVETDHPGWNQQILFQKRRILDAFHSVAPELNVRNLLIRVKSRKQSPEHEIPLQNQTESDEETDFKSEDTDFPQIPLDEEYGRDVLFRQFEHLRKIVERKELQAKKNRNRRP